MESVTDVGCGKAFQKLLVRLADAVVYLIPRRPQGVSTCLWQFHKSQRCIVCRSRLEGDIAVPNSTGSSVICLGVELLALHRRDRANFWVATSKLTRVIQDGVNVQS